MPYKPCKVGLDHRTRPFRSFTIPRNASTRVSKKSAIVTLATLEINANRRCLSQWWSWWSWTPPSGWCCAAAAVAVAISHLHRRGRPDVTSGRCVTYALIPGSRASTKYTPRTRPHSLTPAVVTCTKLAFGTKSGVIASLSRVSTHYGPPSQISAAIVMCSTCAFIHLRRLNIDFWIRNWSHIATHLLVVLTVRAILFTKAYRLRRFKL